MALSHFRANHFAARSLITLGSLVSETGAYLKKWFVRRRTGEDSKADHVVSPRARKIIEAVAREQVAQKLSDTVATKRLKERLEQAYVTWKDEYFQLLILSVATLQVLVEKPVIVADNVLAVSEDDDEDYVIARMLFEFA